MQAGACRDEELDEVLGRSCAVYGLLAGTLCMGYIFSVVLAGAGLPSDGRRSWQGGDIAADVIHVLQGAVLLGWLTSIDRVSRLQWARRYPRRLGLALLCFAATPPVFSSLNEVPGLQFSIDAGPGRRALSGGAVAVVSLAALCFAAILLRHLQLAWRLLSRRSFTAYVLRQGALVGFYAISYAATEAAHSAHRDLRAPHLHHLYIGLVVASFGCFDRLESVLLMAIGSGVFVQGLGAYGFAPLAVVSDCKTVALPVPMAKSLALGSGCTWEDALQPLSAMVRLIVCPADTASQAQSQHMRCGHAL